MNPEPQPYGPLDQMTALVSDKLAAINEDVLRKAAFAFLRRYQGPPPSDMGEGSLFMSLFGARCRQAFEDIGAVRQWNEQPRRVTELYTIIVDIMKTVMETDRANRQPENQPQNDAAANGRDVIAASDPQVPGQQVQGSSGPSGPQSTSSNANVPAPKPTGAARRKPAVPRRREADEAVFDVRDETRGPSENPTPSNSVANGTGVVAASNSQVPGQQVQGSSGSSGLTGPPQSTSSNANRDPSEGNESSVPAPKPTGAARRKPAVPRRRETEADEASPDNPPSSNSAANGRDVIAASNPQHPKQHLSTNQVEDQGFSGSSGLTRPSQTTSSNGNQDPLKENVPSVLAPKPTGAARRKLAVPKIHRESGEEADRAVDVLEKIRLAADAVRRQPENQPPNNSAANVIAASNPQVPGQQVRGSGGSSALTGPPQSTSSSRNQDDILKALIEADRVSRQPENQPQNNPQVPGQQAQGSSGSSGLTRPPQDALEENVPSSLAPKPTGPAKRNVPSGLSQTLSRGPRENPPPSNSAANERVVIAASNSQVPGHHLSTYQVENQGSSRSSGSNENRDPSGENVQSVQASRPKAAAKRKVPRGRGKEKDQAALNVLDKILNINNVVRAQQEQREQPEQQPSTLQQAQQARRQPPPESSEVVFVQEVPPPAKRAPREIEVVTIPSRTPSPKSVEFQFDDPDVPQVQVQEPDESRFFPANPVPQQLDELEPSGWQTYQQRLLDEQLEKSRHSELEYRDSLLLRARSEFVKHGRSLSMEHPEVQQLAERYEAEDRQRAPAQQAQQLDESEAPDQFTYQQKLLQLDEQLEESYRKQSQYRESLVNRAQMELAKQGRCSSSDDPEVQQLAELYEAQDRQKALEICPSLLSWSGRATKRRNWEEPDDDCVPDRKKKRRNEEDSRSSTSLGLNPGVSSPSPTPMADNGPIVEMEPEAEPVEATSSVGLVCDLAPSETQPAMEVEPEVEPEAEPEREEFAEDGPTSQAQIPQEQQVEASTSQARQPRGPKPKRTSEEVHQEILERSTQKRQGARILDLCHEALAALHYENKLKDLPLSYLTLPERVLRLFHIAHKKFLKIDGRNPKSWTVREEVPAAMDRFIEHCEKQITDVEDLMEQVDSFYASKKGR